MYFGLEDFNARARATNFDIATLPDTICELHAHGVRGYVALSTLVFDSEIAALEKTVRAWATSGVDAVIVQDLGGARLVRAVALSASSWYAKTRETSRRLVAAYRALLTGRTSASDLRRALETEGGYGPVSGSLRVL